MAAWKKQRHKRLGKPKFINIEIRDLQKLQVNDSRFQVSFIQAYQADTYSDQVLKTLELAWENGAWAIVEETSRPLKK